MEKTYIFSCHKDVALGWFIYDFREKAPKQIRLPPESVGFVVLGAIVGVTAVTLDIVATGGIGTAVAAASGGLGFASLEAQEEIENDD